MKSIHPQFITDDQGNKLSVILSIKEFKTLLEELEETRRKNIRAKEEREPTKKEILADLKESVQEMKLIRAGKLKAKPIQQLLDEL
ncbi:hypothetical protein [Leptospira santarosai]|uniref:Toxin-antitoxin system, antitoxin component, PHD family n=1 Tax=Leptospira santarosai TaxID=28183 RepID=A0AB73N0N9_9LEPT|nr:hypothetical protein [Leptospira santarosai]AVV51305.1 Uncharacterized protein XB17_02726 [Leptospira santarosai]ONF92293.1 hypothetical protein BWD14_13825 [Leptospira santarosai]